MAEYIERDALIAEIEKAQSSLDSNIDKVWYRNKPYFKGLAWANRLTRDAPTADVVEVRHGEWLYGHIIAFAEECSVCGRCVDLDYLGRRNRYNYCPSCGAKMDGKGDGE